jgi:hypothetical protein
MGMKHWKRAALATATLLATAPPLAAARADPLTDALLGGKPILEIRPRFEGVDQAGFAHDAAAYTVRTQFGWETASWRGLKALVELEDVAHAGPQDYNSTLNHRTAYPTVADPDGFELNRLQLSWTPNKAFTATIGRQRIVLDDQRFVGDANWRQDQQTFDAARADISYGGAKVTLAYLDRINRTVAQRADWNADAWLLNASYPAWPAFKPTVFVYALDFANAKASSTLTYGFRVTGKAKAGPLGLAYDASYAHQSDYRNNPARFSLDYWQADLAASCGMVTGKLAYEQLDGNGHRGFATPLATLHAFEGSADVFLTTPVNGIEDASASVSLRPPVKLAWLSGVELTGRYHDFSAQRGGGDLGHEGDFQATAALTPHLTSLIGYADYRGVPGFPSRRKLVVGLDFKL